MSDENQSVYTVKEGWLNVWEVLCCMDGYSAGRLKDEKHLSPSWEPHLCLLNPLTKKLLHFRSEKAAEEYISRLRNDHHHIPCEPTTVLREWIGPERDDFKRNNMERTCMADLLMVADSTFDLPPAPPVADNNMATTTNNNPMSQSHFAKMGSFQKSQTLDNRSTPSQLLASMNEAGSDKSYSHSTSVVDKRRGSGSSLCSDESTSKPNNNNHHHHHHPIHHHQNQSKLANFFSRKSQQLRSNLKRTKSATKLDRKKTNGDSDGERMSGCMRTSHSHEALLTSPSEVQNSFDLSHPDIIVRPVHSSIWSVEHCFVVSHEVQSVDGVHCRPTNDSLGVPAHLSRSLGASMIKYYRCGSDAEMQRWIVNIKNCIGTNRDRTFRTDNNLQLSIVESKNLPQKKKYYCELYLDGVLYARTSSKLMQDHVFWGEQFNFGELPNVQTISIHLFREMDKKKKRERPFKIGSINIPSSDFKNVSISEKWYEVLSSAGRKGARESRVDGVGVRIKGRYLSVDILPLQYYVPLLEYVQNEYSALVELLEPVISVKAKEGLATCLASSLHCTGHVVTFLCDIVMAEVDRLENNALALRGNSIATKAVEAYMKIVGQKYLVTTLKDVLRGVIDSSVDCEVDPGRLSTSSSLTTNRHTLVTHCTLVWCKIINSSTFFPSELKRLFQMIRWSCEGRSSISVAVCRQLISSCIFLRFFCPAILSPNLFSIIQEFPCDRGVRNLTLIAKTIQSLANLTLFGGKEKFMDFMNSFVSHEIVHMQSYLDNISTINDDEEQRSCDPIIDQSRELALLHSLLVDSFKSVTEEGKVKFSNLNNILRDISSSLDDMPAQLQQQEHLNNNNNTPGHVEETADSNARSNRPSSSTVPPFTPTTIVHPASPIKITPSECVDFPSTSAYVSMISQSLSTAPNMLKSHHHRSTTANESSNITSPEFPNGPASHFTIPESNVLNPLVRQAAVPLDEQQIDRDWKKIIEAAVQSSEGNGSISLVDFNTAGLDLQFSKSNPVINSCSIPQQGHLKQTPRSESPKPLAFNNPTYSRNLKQQSASTFTPHSGKALRHSQKSPVSSSYDNLKLSRNLNGATKSGALPSRVSNLRTACTSSSSCSNPYRSNSSDSIVNCKENTETSNKALASPLSSSTPRINKSYESRKHSCQSSDSPGANPAVSKSFDETFKPRTDSKTKFAPPSSSSSSSEHALSRLSKHGNNADRLGSISTNLKNVTNPGNISQSPRRQTVHYDVSPISIMASPKPSFGTLPLQSLKGRQLHGSSSSPRLQASSNLSTSMQSQHECGDFTSSPSKRPPLEEQQNLDAKQQQKSTQQRSQRKSHLSSSPSLTTSSPGGSISDSQQVTSTRSSSIQTALQRQRHQNRHQQWNSVHEFDRSSELRGTRLNARIAESPLESSESWLCTYPVDFQRSFSCSQPRPSSSSSQSSSSMGRGAPDLRPIDPTSPTSVNHARRLEFFNAGMSGSKSNFKQDQMSGFENRDSIVRNNAFNRTTSTKQRDEVASLVFSPSNPMVSYFRAGRSSPSSFVSLTNHNRRTSRAEPTQAREAISSANQQQSILVYNVENNVSEPIICKSTSC